VSEDGVTETQRGWSRVLTELAEELAPPRRYRIEKGEEMEQFKALSPLSESERNNVEQLLPEVLHIKEEPEMISEGQEEKQLCVQQETNSAVCPVKCEDEEEKPQTSQLHWRHITEMNMKEEPSTCSLNEFMKRQTVGINSKEPEAAQNPDPSSLVLQGPDGTETDSTQTEYSSDDDDDDDDGGCWQKPLSESETEADFDSTRKNSEMSSECVGGKKASLIDTEEEHFECDVCRKCFTFKVSLKRHMKIHTGEKTFQCDVCSKCFIQKDHLQSHMRIHTGEKPFECDVCRKCFNYKVNLKRHMRIHTGEKPFTCDVCGKCFIQNDHLQSHMGVHTGKKQFKCDVCSNYFNRKCNLQLHMRIHTGEKPFKCDVCSKRFVGKPHLQSHMRIHTEEKPFKCDVCFKCFNYKVNLKSHMRIHTGERPFKCDVCSKCFTRKPHLQSHVRMHKNEKPFVYLAGLSLIHPHYHTHSHVLSLIGEKAKSGTYCAAVCEYMFDSFCVYCWPMSFCWSFVHFFVCMFW
uniref:C2H2-type domain-containing protein n=1 Tax=Gouania willdenowi TaxID=441366 RepID=A0A8C5EJU1_GOUWI